MKCTIKQINDFYNEYPECIGKLKANTRFGYKTIQYSGITAENSEIIEVKTKTKSILTSPDHQLYTVDWIKSKDLSVGNLLLTESGYEPITSISKKDYKDDLYDLQIEDVKEFYANGFVSHNSTIIDSLTFGLFGKPFRNISKNQLINSINQKNCLVTIDFDIGKDSYTVKRGIKPNIFEIYKNDELIESAAATKDYQEYLQNHILKLNYKTFTQVVILGSATYTPFMQLPSSQRRDIIEDILDIKVFSLMNFLLKQKIAENKSQLSLMDNDIKMIKIRTETLSKIIDNISQNKQEIIDGINKQLETNNTTIEEITKEIIVLNDEISNLINKEEIKKLSNHIDQLNEQKTELDYILGGVNNDIEFYKDSDQCPECKQEISPEFKISAVSNLLEVKDKHSEHIKLLEETIVGLKDKQATILDNLKIVREKEVLMSAKNSNITLLQQQNKQLLESLQEETNKTESLVETKAQRKELVNSYFEKNKIKEGLVKDSRVYSISQSLLKDDGIKTTIIKDNLILINKLINEYLSAMDFYVKFELDDNLSESIKSRHRDVFSYSSFSEGEKKKIDLAVMLTWRQIAKLKNSVNTNLLIMDEVMDSSLDNESVEMVSNILKNDLEDINMYIISHRETVDSIHFDRFLLAEKPNEFSIIKEV